MKILPLALLLCAILCVALTESKPAPWKRYRGRQRYYSPRSYSSGGSQPNQFLKDLGTAKVVGGAALTGLGLVTNNNGLTNAGLNIGALGVGSKLLAHVFGRK